MILNIERDRKEILRLFQDNGVFIYPTEAVYGIGGNPGSNKVVEAISRLKQGRSHKKGMIIVASNWQQCGGWIGDLSEIEKNRISTLSEKKPTTIIINAGNKLAHNLYNTDANKVALRISTHPTIVKLCELFGQPIISTSANFSGQLPARSMMEAEKYFPHLPIIEGKLGTAKKPSTIIDWQTQSILRN